MIKRPLKIFCIIFALYIQVSMNLSYADVSVNMDQADEIVISNTQEDVAYTFKLDEPNEQLMIAGTDDQVDVNNQASIESTNVEGISIQTTSIGNQNIISNVGSNSRYDASKNSRNENRLANVVKSLPFNREVQLASKITSVEPALIHAIISAESNHNPRAKSAKGAYGLMQLMPSTAKFYKVTDTSDPKQNILAGAKLMQELLVVFNGDIQLSLAAYNAGLPAVLKHKRKIPPFKETQKYVPKVLKLYKKFT